VKLIEKFLKANKHVGAICAAPAVVLGSHGFLKGRKFTCYPGTESSAKDGTLLQDRVVKDGNLITSRGPGTAAEFSLALVEYLAGADAAEKIRKATLQMA
jgi:4-methyl-5(b-hydroxyethyl)-thiazole monophosphate biosynthesis